MPQPILVSSLVLPAPCSKSISTISILPWKPHRAKRLMLYVTPLLSMRRQVSSTAEDPPLDSFISWMASSSVEISPSSSSIAYLCVHCVYVCVCVCVKVQPLLIVVTRCNGTYMYSTYGPANGAMALHSRNSVSMSTGHRLMTPLGSSLVCSPAEGLHASQEVATEHAHRTL